MAQANPLYGSENFSTTLNVGGGINNSQTTGIVLTSVSGLDTSGGILCLDWAAALDTSVAEYIEYGSYSGNTLSGVVRGSEGSSAKAHSNGAVVVAVVSKAHINRLADKLRSVDAVLAQDTSNNEIIKTAFVASAVNEVSVTNAATGNAPSVAATGGDTNVDLNLVSKGTGVIKFNGAAAPTTVPTDGWTTASDTWVYASASTFTIAGADRTAIFTKGTRLKFTNSSLKYAVVVSSSFSTDTTVTIAVNTDYVIANAAISSPFYSYQASPAGYPGSFAFTTTYAGFSANPTPPTKFSVIGNQVTVVFGAANEGTSNATTLTMTVPITSVNVSGQAYKYLGRSVDNGTENIGISSLPANSATLTCSKTTDGSVWTGSGTKAWQGVVTYYI